MKPDIDYVFHHMGIPTQIIRPGERYSAANRMYTSENPGQFQIQWHRFESDSALHPLIKTVAHVAFKVVDLQAAIAGEDLILGPYEPIDGYFVAIINDHGVPIELIQTELSDQILWEKAQTRQGAIYR